MKIRGVILSTCAMVVFFAAYAMAHEPEPLPQVSAKPVKVPYLNKTISEVTEYGKEFDSYGDPAEADGDRDGSVENLDTSYSAAVLKNTGTVEKGETAMPELDVTENEQIIGKPDESSSGEPENPVLNDWIYYGTCRITHYDSGPCCCGEWATGCTASGVLATTNHTVASGEDLPFGTEVLINGQVYVVEDRGVGPYEIDIFVDTHEEALALGMYYTDVYVRY